MVTCPVPALNELDNLFVGAPSGITLSTPELLIVCTPLAKEVTVIPEPELTYKSPVLLTVAAPAALTTCMPVPATTSKMPVLVMI